MSKKVARFARLISSALVFLPENHASLVAPRRAPKARGAPPLWEGGFGEAEGVGGASAFVRRRCVEAWRRNKKRSEIGAFHFIHDINFSTDKQLHRLR